VPALGHRPLRASNRLLRSIDIPPADDLLLVFKLFEMRASGRFIPPSKLGVFRRQILYDRNAARILGFLDGDFALTGRGHRFMALTSRERIQEAAAGFPESVVGKAWAEWSGQSSLDVEPTSSEEFLSEVSQLGSSTARRRAKTHRTWMTLFRY
jgi:hypothetical protein